MFCPQQVQAIQHQNASAEKKPKNAMNGFFVTSGPGRNDLFMSALQCLESNPGKLKRMFKQGTDNTNDVEKPGADKNNDKDKDKENEQNTNDKDKENEQNTNDKDKPGLNMPEPIFKNKAGHVIRDEPWWDQPIDKVRKVTATTTNPRSYLQAWIDGKWKLLATISEKQTANHEQLMIKLEAKVNEAARTSQKYTKRQVRDEAHKLAMARSA